MEMGEHLDALQRFGFGLLKVWILVRCILSATREPKMEIPAAYLRTKEMVQMKSSMTRRALLKKTATGMAAASGIGFVPPLSLDLLGKTGASVAGQPQAAAGGTNLPWYRRLRVGIEIGPNHVNDQDQIFYSRATGKEFIESLVKAKAEYGVIYGKDEEFAYYNSKVARKCPNLKERDLLRESLDEAKKHGITIVAYCLVQHDPSSWRAHPDWRMKNPEGKDIYDCLCYNSGYIEFIKQVLAEMMEYEIAGFHVDMLDFGFEPPIGCWCEHCQAAFKEEYGIPLPPGVTWDEPWDKMLEFRANSNTRFCQKLRAFVREKRPDVAVDFNYHGYPPFAWIPGELPVKHTLAGDFVTAEGMPGRFGHNNVSMLAQFLAGARLDGPTQVASNRGMVEYQDPTLRPLPDLKWEILTYLAHGAQCTIVDKVNYDGTCDRLVYERLGQAFGEARAKNEYWGHKPLQEVGLYYSSRTRDWYAREDTTKYTASFFGAHWGLMRSQIPLGMIMDENVSPERLREFSVVYLPGTAILSEREVALFEEYVSNGGNLLVTGITGLYGRNGNLQDKCALSELLGVRLSKLLEHQDNYFRLPAALAPGEGKFLSQGIPSDWPVFAPGPAALYEAAGAQAFGDLMIAFRPGNPHWKLALSAEKTIGPAVFVNRHGKGKAILVPVAVDYAYTTPYRTPEHRSLIRNIVRYLNPNPPVLIHAPVNVEAIVTHDEARKRLLVHLISFSGPATATAAPFGKGSLVLPPLMEEPLSYEARIKVNKPFTAASAAGRESVISKTGNEVRLKTSGVHEVLIIKL
jgi:hypothetical protein